MTCIQTVLDRISVFYEEVLSHAQSSQKPDSDCLIRIAGQFTRFLYAEGIKPGATRAADLTESLDDLVTRLSKDPFELCGEMQKYGAAGVCLVCREFNLQRYRTLIECNLPVMEEVKRSSVMEHVRDQSRKCNTARWVGDSEICYSTGSSLSRCSDSPN